MLIVVLVGSFFFLFVLGKLVKHRDVLSLVVTVLDHEQLVLVQLDHFRDLL